MAGRIIAVTGGKGGVGKSTTTINLGVSLRLDGHSVVLVDADVEMPNLMEMLGIEAETTIHDVLSGTAETTEALVEMGEAFSALPGDSSLTGYGTIEPDRLHTVVDTLTTTFDYVLLDTGAGLSYDDLFPLAIADDILLVSSPDPAAIENAKRTAAFIGRLNQQIGGLVITKATSKGDVTVAEGFDAELVGVIPKAEVVSQSTAEGKPLELTAPDSNAAEAYRQLEANLTDGQMPPSRVVQAAEAETSGESSEPEDATPEPSDAEGDRSETDGEESEEIETPKRGLMGRIASLVT